LRAKWLSYPLSWVTGSWLSAPVASVRAVLGAYSGQWLLMFDNAIDETSVQWCWWTGWCRLLPLIKTPQSRPVVAEAAVAITEAAIPTPRDRISGALALCELG
jgi:hypothetical protein